MLIRDLPPDTNLLDVQRLAPQRYPLLLESVAEGALSRWDFLLACDGSGLRLDADGVTRDLQGAARNGSFLANLDAQWRAARIAHEPLGPPFRGGWALFLAYELAAQIEPVLRLPAATNPLPVALALRCPAALIRDRQQDRVYALCESEAAAWLDTIAADAAEVADQMSISPIWQASTLREDEPQRFSEGVRRILDYLAAGDVFQVNLSRAWRARFEQMPDPAMLYRQLRSANPAPFAGLLRWQDWALLSSSPERLVSVQGHEVATRPIAGTRPRLPGDDEPARIRELIGHPKERAEHVMLIDLERNDLGRVCAPGSVRVDELMTVESYAHVHHIVSNVRGVLREGATPGEVIAAVFPGGTITGCPKVRCMQVIAELEGEGRGPYTGALGWLNRDGDMDLNILIRSAWASGTQLEFRTGAGIVIDSQPERELDETRDKARGLLRAWCDQQ